MQVTWSDDGAAAYLIDENGNIVGRWFRDRPELNTFDPSTYEYGQGYSYQDPEQGKAWMYDAWRRGGGNGGDGGYLQSQWRMEYDEDVRRWEVEREQAQQQFDAQMAHYEKDLAQRLEEARMQIASSEGMQKYEWEQVFKQLEQQHGYAVQYLQLDYAERHKILDKEIAFSREEMWSRERIEAATRSAQPINFRIYENWMAGLGGQADPSGLPPGAPGFQTGPGMEGAVAGGDVPRVSPYEQAYASGQRIPEFQASGGPAGLDPHKVNLTQFMGSPLQSQEMQYGRWRERGYMPYTAEQRMRAAAPTGTAGQRVPGYG